MEEWKLKEAVEHIRPDDRLEAKVLGLYGKRPARSSKRGWKAAVSFAAAAAVVCGLLFWPQGTSLGQKAGVESSPIPAPQTGFAVVVNAATKDSGEQTELVPGRAFQIVDEEAGEEVMGMSNDGKSQDWEAVFGFQLKCIGKEIEKITYETDRGTFQKRVRLNPMQELEYKTFRQFPYSKLTAAPEQGYAYAPIGASQELSPEQKSDGILYLRLTMHTENEPAADDDFKFSTKYQKMMLDGTKIKITAAFRDGTESFKTVTLSYADSVPDGSSRTITAVAD